MAHFHESGGQLNDMQRLEDRRADSPTTNMTRDYFEEQSHVPEFRGKGRGTIKQEDSEVYFEEYNREVHEDLEENSEEDGISSEDSEGESSAIKDLLDMKKSLIEFWKQSEMREKQQQDRYDNLVKLQPEIYSEDDFGFERWKTDQVSEQLYTCSMETLKAKVLTKREVQEKTQDDGNLEAASYKTSRRKSRKVILTDREVTEKTKIAVS